MKIAVVPDLHLNKATYKTIMDREFADVPFRSADFMRSFRWIIDKCINDIKPNLFVIPGDVYNQFDPSNAVRGFFSSQILRLTEQDIPVVILTGNHDVCRKHHALKDIQELGLSKVKVVDSPRIMLLREGIKLLLFPYSLDIEQKKVTIKEEFEKFLKEVRKRDDGKPSIFFGHFGVVGGKLNEYEEENELLDILTDSTVTPVIKIKKKFVNNNPDDIDISDLDRIGSDYVLLGDYHEFQRLPTSKCIAIYPGSIEKTDFSEMSQRKGFIVYDSEGEMTEELGLCKFIEYPHCRSMKEFKGNLTQIKKQFSELDPSQYKEPIVKIYFEGTSEELFEFSTGLESFKKEVRKVLNPIHLYHIQKIRNPRLEANASRIEKEILDKGHMEADDVLAVVKEIIVERVKDKDEQQKTIDLAVEIYQGTKI